jgi:hypothetical protein
LQRPQHAILVNGINFERHATIVRRNVRARKSCRPLGVVLATDSTTLKFRKFDDVPYRIDLKLLAVKL